MHYAGNANIYWIIYLETVISHPIVFNCIWIIMRCTLWAGVIRSFEQQEALCSKNEGSENAGFCVGDCRCKLRVCSFIILDTSGHKKTAVGLVFFTGYSISKHSI